MDFDEIVEKLKKGNKRFVADKRDGKLQDSNRRKALTGGQSPWAVILGCADSRVVPELIFDTGLGELFTVRVAGNIANSASIASIEYAVTHLNVRIVVVLGHENCGAVAAALEDGDAGYHLNLLLAHIKPAKELLKNKDISSVIRKNAELAAEELEGRSPILSDGVKMGKLKILSSYYHLESGKVDFLDD